MRLLPPWRQKIEMNMAQAINSALDCALGSSPKTFFFGEDVAFGGVFRCSLGLQSKYGKGRVFNTPDTEQGIMGFAIGLASNGWEAIAEIQFADYLYPGLDQLANEAAKYRYRSGGMFDCGGLTVRAPCGAVGHGGTYHSQSPESFLTHLPGLKVVMPSTPSEAKGLLLSCIEDRNPCVFLEPKALYRTVTQEVECEGFYTPLGEARVVTEGHDLTVISYGAQLRRVHAGVELAKVQREGLSVEVIDLRTLLPFDLATLAASVRKTGRFLVTHEAPVTSGFGAELVASLTKECFLYLDAPPRRVCGLDSPFPHIYEAHYLPNKQKLCDTILEVCSF